MDSFQLLATPIWVNFLILIPILLFIYFRKNKLSITNKALVFAALFGITFGFVEAACVIYLRASVGLLPGFQGTLADVQRQSIELYNQAQALNQLPQSLITIEFIRNAVTILMIISVSVLGTLKPKDRFGLFVWIFAFWDIFYYVFLYLLVRWPSSLTTPDVLFLIPVPWIGQVWLPILISSLLIASVLINNKPQK